MGDPAAFDRLMERVLAGETAVIHAGGKDVAVILPIAEYDALRSQLASGDPQDTSHGRA